MLRIRPVAAAAGRTITVTAVTFAKVYDGTTTATGAAPTVNPALATGDSATLTEAYSDKNAGAGNKILIPTAIINDGNNGLNYTVTPVNLTTGTITPKPLTAFP